MGALDFTLRLLDRVSDPATKISRQLGNVERDLDKTGKQMAALEGKTGEDSVKLLRSYQKQNQALNDQKAKLLGGQVAVAGKLAAEAKLAEAMGEGGKKAKEQGGSLDKLATFATKAYAAFVALRGVVDFGAAGGAMLLDAQRYRETTAAALKFQLGSEAAAQKTMGFIRGISRATGQDRRAVAADLQKLIGSGLTTGESEQLVQLAASVRQVSGKDVGVDKFGEALLSLKRNEALSVEKAFAGLIEGGAQNRVYEALAKRLNIKSAGLDPVAIKRLVDQRLAGGPGGLGAIRGKDAVNLFRDVNLDVVGEKAFGGAKQAFQAKNVTGAIDLVKQRLRDLFDDADASPLATRLLGILNRVATALDPGSDSGKAFLATIDKIVDTAGRVYDVISPLLEAFGGGFGEGFGQALDDVLEFLRLITAGSGGSKDFAASLRTIGKALGELIVGTAVVIGFVGWLVAAIVEGATELPGAMKNIGIRAIDGMVEGFESVKDKLTNAAKGIKDAVVGTLQGLFQIHSPSRVMAQLGAYTAQGFAQGVQGGAPGVADAARSGLAQPTVQGAQIRPQGGSRGTMVIPQGAVQITVQGQVDEERLAQLVEERMRALFQQMGLELGTAT